MKQTNRPLTYDIMATTFLMVTFYQLRQPKSNTINIYKEKKTFVSDARNNQMIKQFNILQTKNCFTICSKALDTIIVQLLIQYL